MKNKKGAFANSNTGYGKHSHRHNHTHSKDTKERGSTKNDTNSKDNKEADSNKENEQNDQELNSGFGDYLRSPEAVEMMKLFVFANTIMLIVTMAWPHFREQYIWLMAWLASFQDTD